MRSLSDTQTFLRLQGRESGEGITSGTGNVLANAVLRRIALGLPWPELRVLNTDMTTTAGAGALNWPDVQFLDIKALEIQNGDDLDRYAQIYPPPSEHAWTGAQSLPSQAVPFYYMRYQDEAVAKLELRGAPKYDAKIVRITGIQEPPKLDSDDDPTFFQLETADDAYVYMLAAAFNDIDGNTPYADRMMGQALQIYQGIFGRRSPPRN